MALSQSALSELLEAFRAGEGVDLIRESVRLVMQELIEAEATEHDRRRPLRAHRRRGSPSATGHRPRLLSTQAGDVELRIPKLRKGSFFPSHPGAAPADRPGPVRGGDGGLRPRASRPARSTTWSHALGDRLGDLQVRGVPDLRRAGRERRRVPHPPPRTTSSSPTSTWTPPTCTSATPTCSQVVSMAVVVATGITADGDREVLGLDVGDSEDEVFWRGFLRSLKQRGLAGVRLVISDQHAGLVAAMRAGSPGRGAPTLPGALRPQPARPRPQGPPETWSPRCSAPIFAQPDPDRSPPPGTRSATSSPASSPRSAG